MEKSPLPAEHLIVGRIIRAQGLRGEVRVAALGGDPALFLDLDEVTLVPEEEPRKLAKARVHGGKVAVIKFKGLDTIESITPLIGRDISIRRDQFPEVEDDDTFYWVDLVGCEVVDCRIGSIGVIRALLHSGAHENLVVDRPDGREALIPFVEAMVTKVDLEGRRVDVDLPEGLVE